MKPETTWKEEVRKWFTSEMWFGMEPYGDLSEDLTDFPDTLEFIESLLSSSQALARRETLNEAMKIVKEMGLRSNSVGTVYFATDVIDEIKALQEKLDTKGV